MSVAKVFQYQNKYIYIDESVIDIFMKYNQNTYKDNEACGILMCSINKDNGNVYINNATTPQANDIRKRAYFFLKDTKHQEQLNQEFKKSKGTVFLCGTWHSHPEDIPSASALDKKEWNKFKQGNTEYIEDFYFVIVGRKKIVLYTLEKDTVILIEEES